MIAVASGSCGGLAGRGEGFKDLGQIRVPDRTNITRPLDVNAGLD